MTTTEAGTSEYDRFGPWIDEVRTPQDVPRLYRDHPLDLDTARLVLKVPRNIARRDATADMDLYDHLLVLDDVGLTALSRRTGGPGTSAKDAEGYDVRVAPYRSVVALLDVVSLLDATLTIVTTDGSTLAVRYNGSARDNVRRLVDEIRAATTVAAPSPVGRALLDAGRTAAAHSAALTLGNDDVALVSDVREVRRRLPDLTPWTWHGRRRVHPQGGGAAGVVRAAWHALSPATLHAAVLAGDDHALEIVARHAWLVRGRAPVHSLSRLVVPLAVIDDVRVVAHPAYRDVVVATLHVGGTTLDLAVPDGSGAHHLLAGIADRPATPRTS